MCQVTEWEKKTNGISEYYETVVKLVKMNVRYAGVIKRNLQFYNFGRLLCETRPGLNFHCWCRWSFSHLSLEKAIDWHPV